MQTRHHWLGLVLAELVAWGMPAAAYDVLTAADAAVTGPVGYCAARAAGLPPPQVRVERARGFTVTYHDDYKLITVGSPWRNAPRPYRYVAACPGHGPLPPADRVLTLPITRGVYLSSTHLGQVAMLDAVTTVVGVHSPDYVASPAVRARLASGAAVAVGHGATVDPERVVRLQPDLVMAFALGDPSDIHPTLEAVDVPVVLNAEFVEATPLGRAEWLKFVAALLDREAVANRLVARIETAYAEVAGAVPDGAAPKVISGAPWRGTWYAPAGGSYLARLIADAGGHYTWKHRPGEISVVVDLEQVVRDGADADVWLTSTSQADLAASLRADPRLGLLKPVASGRVFNNNGGRRDYWEYGAVNPHVALADLVTIFYPGALSDHTLTFFVRHGDGEPAP